MKVWRDNKKENNKKKRKKRENNKKELKYLLWDIAMYFKLSFLKYTSQWYIQTISCISVFSFFKSYSAFDSIYPNLLTVEVSGIFVELNPSDNTRNIALDRFHFFWQYGEYHWSSSQFSFIMFMAKCFFLLIHFIVVEDYELSQSTIHLLSVPSALEYARILSWSIFFFFLHQLSSWCSFV